MNKQPVDCMTGVELRDGEELTADTLDELSHGKEDGEDE